MRCKCDGVVLIATLILLALVNVCLVYAFDEIALSQKRLALRMQAKQSFFSARSEIELQIHRLQNDNRFRKSVQSMLNNRSSIQVSCESCDSNRELSVYIGHSDFLCPSSGVGAMGEYCADIQVESKRMADGVPLTISKQIQGLRWSDPSSQKEVAEARKVASTRLEEVTVTVSKRYWYEVAQ